MNGSQQQYLVRNSNLDGWSNGVWNQVFAGVEGAPAQSFPNPPYTTLDANPESREKPFLYVDANNRFNVYVPDVQLELVRHDLGERPDAGPLDLDRATSSSRSPGDSEQTINKALASGMNLIFTPGVYDIDKTIKVKRPDTVVLGLGIATLTAQDGAIAMTVDDVHGVVDLRADLRRGAGQLAGAAPGRLAARTRRRTGTRPDATSPTRRRSHDVFFRHRRRAHRQGDDRASR